MCGVKKNRSLGGKAGKEERGREEEGNKMYTKKYLTNQLTNIAGSYYYLTE
jgi:hypothetical protein